MAKKTIVGTQKVDYGQFGVVTYEHDGTRWLVVGHVEVEGVEGVIKQRDGLTQGAVEKARADWMAAQADEVQADE